MKAGIVLALLALGFVAVTPVHADTQIVVNDAWIREAPPGAPALAGYMRIENRGAADSALAGARADGFGMVMIHQTVHEGGIARMVHADRIELPAGASVSFEPGGYHLMLMSPQRELGRGEHIEIVLELAGGAELPVSFEVRSATHGVQ